MFNRISYRLIIGACMLIQGFFFLLLVFFNSSFTKEFEYEH